jgi:hypothetical protein
MSRAVRKPHTHALYERDFHAWTQEQARLVRARRFAELDVDNIAEELETLGRSDRREVKSRLTVVLVHLLKWQFRPQKRGPSWQATLSSNATRCMTCLAKARVLQDTQARCWPIAIGQQSGRRRWTGSCRSPPFQRHVLTRWAKFSTLTTCRASSGSRPFVCENPRSAHWPGGQICSKF